MRNRLRLQRKKWESVRVETGEVVARTIINGGGYTSLPFRAGWGENPLVEWYKEADKIGMERRKVMTPNEMLQLLTRNREAQRALRWGASLSRSWECYIQRSGIWFWADSGYGNAAR
jgi:hypothetical protein